MNYYVNWAEFASEQQQQQQPAKAMSRVHRVSFLIMTAGICQEQDEKL